MIRFNLELPADTESVRYLGSKAKLLPRILELAAKTGAKSVFDGFAGSTRVGQAFAKKGYRVASCDVSEYSRVLGTCYLLNEKSKEEYRGLIEHLNGVPPKEGWFSEHYGSDGCSKKPWQKHNAMKLEAVREEIARLKLDNISECVALSSLMLALDSVDSTMGHFSSYLKEWSPRSFKSMKLKIPSVWKNESKNEAIKGDVFDSLKSINADLAYYDPPYGSCNEKAPQSRVRYSSYYHVWNTICLNDRPELFGAAARRKDSSDLESPSVFESFRKSESGRFEAAEAIERLLRETPCPWIILSYSAGGRASWSELVEAARACGELVEAVEISHRKNAMAGMKWTNEWASESQEPHKEFLFLIKKS